QPVELGPALGRALAMIGDRGLADRLDGAKHRLALLVAQHAPKDVAEQPHVGAQLHRGGGCVSHVRLRTRGGGLSNPRGEASGSWVAIACLSVLLPWGEKVSAQLRDEGAPTRIGRYGRNLKRTDCGAA